MCSFVCDVLKAFKWFWFRKVSDQIFPNSGAFYFVFDFQFVSFMICGLPFSEMA